MIKFELPYRCKVCGLSDINEEYAFCEFCGWTADSYHDVADEWGGVSPLRLSEYKKIWESHKTLIVDYEGDSKADFVEEIFRKQNPCLLQSRINNNR